MDWKEVAVMMSLILVVNGAFAWSIKLLLNNQWKKMDEQVRLLAERAGDNRERIDQLNRDLAGVRECLPKDYVRREDWIVGFGRMEHKIDAIWRFIHDNFGK